MSSSWLKGGRAGMACSWFFCRCRLLSRGPRPRKALGEICEEMPSVGASSCQACLTPRPGRLTHAPPAEGKRRAQGGPGRKGSAGMETLAGLIPKRLPFVHHRTFMVLSIPEHTLIMAETLGAPALPSKCSRTPRTPFLLALPVPSLAGLRCGPGIQLVCPHT